MTKRQYYRSLSLRMENGSPATYDKGTRSVEVVAATENPVQVYDYSRGEMVNEVLLMSGMILPENNQVPLLDSHSRYSTHSVIGSFRNMTVVGSELVGRAFFSSVEAAQDPHIKVAEGHITDFSVGFRIEKNGLIFINDGETAHVDGRTWTGPLRLITSSRIKELSVCPIGVDDKAKARADSQEGALPLQEENLMDKKLRAFLERHGLPKDATEAEAFSFWERMDIGTINNEGGQQQGKRADDGAGQQPAAQQPAKQTVITEADIAAATRAATQQAMKEERARTMEIRAMCKRYDLPDLEDELIENNTTVDEARKLVMEKDMARDRNEGYGHRGIVSVGVEDKEKFRAAAQDAIRLRSGAVVDNMADGADELAGRSMVELCRMSLQLHGYSDSGRPLDVVGRALQSTDLSTLLGNTANLSLLSGWDSAGETWSIWCATGSVTDFKTHSAARLSETDDLDEIPENQEYKYGEVSEAAETYSIATYGKLFAITRQAIINDELGVLTDIPYSHGEAAARKIGDLAYAVLTANSAMGDGVALFHSSHSNLGTSGVISETTMGEGVKLMKQQKDIADKRRLNIQPAYFIAPTSIEAAAETFFASDMFVGSNVAATRRNIYGGNKYTRVYEPRLDDDSTTAWYLAGAKGKTIKIFFLDGIQKPYLEMQNGWTVDGVEHKVRIDAGAKAMDWRGLVKNAGA